MDLSRFGSSGPRGQFQRISMAAKGPPRRVLLTNDDGPPSPTESPFIAPFAAAVEAELGWPVQYVGTGQQSRRSVSALPRTTDGRGGGGPAPCQGRDPGDQLQLDWQGAPVAAGGGTDRAGSGHTHVDATHSDARQLRQHRPLSLAGRRHPRPRGPRRVRAEPRSQLGQVRQRSRTKSGAHAD
jgi:hypothetical protein